MGSDSVVVVAPLLDEDLGLLQAVEDFAIEQLVPQLAVEAFAIAVLPGAAGLDVERLGTNTCQPAAYNLGGHWADRGRMVASIQKWSIGS